MTEICLDGPIRGRGAWHPGAFPPKGSTPRASGAADRSPGALRSQADIAGKLGVGNGITYQLCIKRTDDKRGSVSDAGQKICELTARLDESIETLLGDGSVTRDNINTIKNALIDKMRALDRYCLSRIPTHADLLWKTDHLPQEKPVEFITRVYGEAISFGMNQGDLRLIDRDLYRAFHNYCSYRGISPDTFLPPSRQKIDVEAVQEKFGDAVKAAPRRVLAVDEDPERARAYHAIATRKWRARQSDAAPL